MVVLSLVLLIFLLFGVSADQVPLESTRRCTVYDTCWPSDVAWAELNHTLSGHLVRSLPAAAPCHDPHYDEEACEEAKTNWYDSFWRAKQPGGYQDTTWEGDCFVDDLRSVRCEQGSVPYYTAAVRSVEDVQGAVEFARKHRLRTRIKGVRLCFYIGNINGIVYLLIYILLHRLLMTSEPHFPYDSASSKLKSLSKA